MSISKNSISNLQHDLFDRLKNITKDNAYLMDVLSNLLNISSDAMYRRMRGEKLLNLEELIKICLHFNISLDEIIGIKKQSLQFNYVPLDLREPEIYKLYMKSLLNSFSDLSKADDKEVFYTAVDIPMFHFLPYVELTLFKVFSWSNSTGAFQGKYGEFCNLIKDDELLDIYKQQTAVYNAIPSVEIWTEGTFDAILRSIDYYYQSGYFSNADEALLLCHQLLEMVAKINKWSNRGFKDELSTKIPYKLYLSDMELENNYVILRRGEMISCIIKLYTINSMSTIDPDFCNESMKWISNTMKKSILISGGLQKESFKFFNHLTQKIRHLIEQIENTKKQHSSTSPLY
ncbi:MAG: hypothetical protein K0M40_12125 [Prolixibacteraceae bacterium]|nr:hypothetical protein [Prolixibacteraceae bacterium]